MPYVDKYGVDLPLKSMTMQVRRAYNAQKSRLSYWKKDIEVPYKSGQRMMVPGDIGLVWFQGHLYMTFEDEQRYRGL